MDKTTIDWDYPSLGRPKNSKPPVPGAKPVYWLKVGVNSNQSFELSHEHKGWLMPAEDK